MAFEVPSHLPRKGNPQDVSTRILSTISEATTKSLTAELAGSWVAELDETIHSTKKRIHERLRDDWSSFERQLSTSKSIQARLRLLTTDVDDLSHAVSDPELGLIPHLVKSLTAHASLAQEATDARVTLRVLSHLLQCRSKFNTLASLLQEGNLPKATSSCENLQTLLAEAPEPLGQADVFKSLNRDFQALKARAEEQLDDAYSRSVVVSASEIIIRPSIQVRQSQTVLNLSSILASLSPEAVSSHMMTLRRDITSHYIDYILKQPISLSVSKEKDPSGVPEYRLSLFPSPPSSEVRSSRLENLSTVVSFLNTHLFPCLPPSQNAALRQSLCRPLTTALLNHFLIPFLPSSLSLLPSFLELSNQAVKFEEDYIANVLEDASKDRQVKSWVDGIGGHYEKKRRIEILENARTVITRTDDETHSIQVEVASTSQIIPVQTEAENFEDDSAWGFEKADENGESANGWEFDEEPAPNAEINSSPSDSKEEDPADAWGWNDEEASVPTVDDAADSEQDAWDDPWNDPPDDSNVISTPASSVSVNSPKPATRLEKKFSAKSKTGRSSLDSYSPVASPLTSSAHHVPSPLLMSFTAPAPGTKAAGKRPDKIAVEPLVKETYMVNGVVKDVLDIVGDTLREGAEFAASNICRSTSSSSSASPGVLLVQTGPAVLDLFRALRPVKFSSEFSRSASSSMRFSNDCLYLSEQIGPLEKMATRIAAVQTKLAECKDHLKVLGDSWFENNVEKEQGAVDDILSRAQGFVDTGDQDQFDECESAVNEVLRNIRFLAQQWKSVLVKSKYYVAIGLVAEAAISRVLEDILALPDIPEVESHKLSELCRIFNALEGLFVENPEKSSMVVGYVPSWLKFSYLSELLEASIADISYLFEEGALVDFEVDELVKLVRALFADTPLRTNTINKLMGGHPTRH